MAINSRKVAIVGCGFVGSATAFALMQSGLFSEIVMLDADMAKAEGEALDISHGVPFSKPCASNPDTFSVYTIKSRMALSSSTQ